MLRVLQQYVTVMFTTIQVPLSQQPLRSIECTNIRDEECKHILKDVSLTVKCGQMLAILGGSGSGKTTLLDVIANRHEGGFVEGEVKYRLPTLVAIVV